MVYTKTEHEEYLNQTMDLAPDSDEWIIGGKFRIYHAYRGLYGRALRKYDPITFNVSFNERRRELFAQALKRAEE